MCARDKPSHIKDLNWNGSPALYAGAIIGFAAIGNVVSSAGTFDLQIANSPLRIDRSKAEQREMNPNPYAVYLTESCLKPLSVYIITTTLRDDLPTLEVASVKLDLELEEILCWLLYACFLPIESCGFA